MLDERRILVTGATSGIGRATVAALADDGATVVATGRDEQRLAAVADLAGVHGAAADLTDRTAVDDLVARAVETMGGLDGLVNSAGLALPTGIVDANRED